MRQLSYEALLEAVKRAEYQDWQRTRKGTPRRLTLPQSARRLIARDFLAWRERQQKGA